jgi:hypothetical protein
MESNMCYNFPRSRFVDENTIHGQVMSIVSEADESFRALYSPDLPPDLNEIMALAMEIMDVYHSAETALRILEEKHEMNIQQIQDAVYQKNKTREYYKCDRRN